MYVSPECSFWDCHFYPNYSHSPRLTHTQIPFRSIQPKPLKTPCGVTMNDLYHSIKGSQTLHWRCLHGARATTHRGVIIHVQYSRLGTPAVNHIYRVHLRWVCVFMVWEVWLGGNMSCTGGGWVRYMKAGRVLKGLGVLFTVNKTDWL